MRLMSTSQVIDVGGEEDEDDEDPLAFTVIDVPEIEPGTSAAVEQAQAGKVMIKVAKFAHKTRYSARAKGVFKENCVKKKVDKPHNVRRDCKTRWNSTGDMAEDGDRTFPAIISTQNDSRLAIPHPQRLVAGDHKYIKAFIKLLQPLKKATLVLSRSGVPMLADVIVHFDSLDFVYTNIAKDASEPLYVRHAARRACAVFNKYYQLTDKSHLYRIAILLHPSMRVAYLEAVKWEKDWIERAIEVCEEVYERFYKPKTAPAAPKTTSPFGYLSFMSHMYSHVTAESQGAGGSNAKSALQDFINGAPLIDLDENGEPLFRNPLVWWHKQRVAGNEMHGLTQMALDVMTMPATSVDVERAFSFAGSIVSKRRHNLAPYTIQATATLGAYSKAGLVKKGCLTLLRKANAQAKAAEKAKD